MMTMDDRRWGDRCRDEPQLCMQMSMRGAMYVTMTICDPVSSSNVKGRGASPATPWYVPTIVAFG